MIKNGIAILDFGAEDTAQIVRYIRQQGVYSQVFAYDTGAQELQRLRPAGIIVSMATTEPIEPEFQYDPGIAKLGIPLLEVVNEPVAPAQVEFKFADDQERAEKILHTFIFKSCGCSGQWGMSEWITWSMAQLKAGINQEEVLLGLSGGVDSSVAAVLLHRAIGRQLHCVYVDTGLQRYNEGNEVAAMFRDQLGMDLHMVDAKAEFYRNLQGITDPEEKRKIIGHTFIDTFARKAREFENCRYLAQGTICPDVIESINPLRKKGVAIKSHHNVGGLPPDLQFELVEPLRELFKDEVRVAGRLMGMSSAFIDRQPFPGPGLGVRILGEITPERVHILQQADLRVQEEMKKLPDYQTIWQSFAILLPVKSVGVKDGKRTYENVCALRAVNSVDAMSAAVTHIPYATLTTISNRIIAEVDGINRVVFDISSKPPATIEWE